MFGWRRGGQDGAHWFGAAGGCTAPLLPEPGAGARPTWLPHTAIVGTATSQAAPASRSWLVSRIRAAEVSL